MRRAFVLLVLGGRDHGRPELLGQLGLPAFDEQARLIDRAPVLLERAEAGDARRQAALDVVLEAGPVAPAVNDLVARSDPEQPMRQAHRPSGHRGRHERTGVHVAVARHLARHEQARRRSVVVS
jgi:hypothetical protein